MFGGRILLLMTVAAAALAAPALRFEVASIKPAKNDSGKGSLELLPGGGLRMGGATLKQLTAMAYGLRESQISGGPSWIDKEYYDVLAKPEPADPVGGSRQPAPGSPAWTRLQERLQALLDDRFHLRFHKDGKPAAMYALVIAKSGFKLQPSQQDVPPGTMRSRGRIEGRAGTMEMLATVLGNFLGKPVEDRTGLTDRYDYKLEYGQEAGPGAPGEPVEGASVFTALQEQLGLKLESIRGTVETMVIERADRPSAN